MVTLTLEKHSKNTLKSQEILSAKVISRFEQWIPPKPVTAGSRTWPHGYNNHKCKVTKNNSVKQAWRNSTDEDPADDPVDRGPQNLLFSGLTHSNLVLLSDAGMSS